MSLDCLLVMVKFRTVLTRMAASNNVFNEKETNNWFKAYLALNLTKEGLANFLDTELQKFHTTVGISCGNCSIEKLIPCPTPPYCKKSKQNCRFHTSQKPQHCSSCDQVKQNIILQHRYSSPSWRNTDAKKWTSDSWEIGKCFLPPDGYSSVHSVQESDFNGVISVMLNCTHFQNCLSTSCLSLPPPDKKFLLEMVRQIGRDVRHTSDCKVKDADLQSYFKTLSTLLADPKSLHSNNSATIARTKLNDLQNDRMICLKELGELLKQADQTLKHAKRTAERFSKEAENTLLEALQRLEDSVRTGERRIESTTKVGEQRLKRKTHSGEQSIKRRSHVGEQRIESTTKVGEHRLKRTTQVGEQHLLGTTKVGEQRLKSGTQVWEQRLKNRTHTGEQRIERKTHVGEQRIERITKIVEQRIESKRQDFEQGLERKIQDGTQRIERNLQDGIVRMQKEANKTAREYYELAVADTARSATSELPSWIVRNSVDPPPELPSIERI